MKVGILDIVALPSKNLWFSAFNLVFSKEYSAITPQVVSVWCRQAGHITYYATYYGVGKAEKMLPDDLDIIFIACCSQFAPFAYALAKLYRKAGVITVIGGAHAKSFPQDCLRFFDIVVKDCNKNLILDILSGHFKPESSISSAQSYTEIPTLQEREPEIRAASYFNRRWRNPLLTTIPILSSVGCPYTCNFCTDWDNPYQLLSVERLVTDIQYAAQHLPGTMLLFLDPNFAVKFDAVIEALESIPHALRMPYLMECSLSILSESRIERLAATGCTIALFGIESWLDYTNKSGLGRRKGVRDKLSNTIALFNILGKHIPYLQSQFIFGIDSDKGDEPVALTKEFISQTPYAWPVINIPTPFGGTPLADELLSQNRILKSMSFNFYYTPFMVIIPKNYEIIEYFEKLIDLSGFVGSEKMSKLRMKTAKSLRHKVSHYLRTTVEREFTHSYREILALLRSDSRFLAFHEGRSEVLPDFYRQHRNESLGSYAELLSEQDWIPDLTYQKPVVV